MEASSRVAGVMGGAADRRAADLGSSVAAGGQLAALQVGAKGGERGGLLGHARGDELGDGVAARRGLLVKRLLRSGGRRLFFVERRAARLERLAAPFGRRRYGRRRRWLRGRRDGVGRR